MTTTSSPGPRGRAHPRAVHRASGAFDSTGRPVLDPTAIPISTAPGFKSQLAVAANGPFLVTWFDRRRRADTDDLYATRVDPNGTVAHPDGFELASSVASAYPNASSSAVAPGSHHGTFSVTYLRHLAERPYGADRVFSRTVNRSRVAPATSASHDEGGSHDGSANQGRASGEIEGVWRRASPSRPAGHGSSRYRSPIGPRDAAVGSKRRWRDGALTCGGTLRRPRASG